MHADSHFLESLAMVLCVAAATTVLCQRVHLPVVLGYLLAGVLIGPHAPPLLVADPGIIVTLSELGVILLMFYIGMELSLRKLVEIGPRGFVVVLVEMGLMLFLGYLAGRLAGFAPIECAFLAAMVAISSTTIIARTFEEHRVSPRVREQIFGALVIEDIFAILLIALLTTLATTRSLDVAGLATAAGRLGIFLTVLMLVGLLVVPRLIRFVVSLKRPETTLVTSVGVCFAAALAAQRYEYSVALGAFLAGCLVAESGEGKRIAGQIRPLRDMFTAVFFVSVGLSIDPAQMFAQWHWIALFSALVVVGKFVGVALGFFATGSPVKASAQAGLAMGQIGEFSFIIAGLGVSLGAIDSRLYPIAVGVSCLTTLLTPFAVQHSARLGERIDQVLPRALQTFVALYGSWIEHLGDARRRGTLGARVRRLVRLIVLDAALLVALLIASSAGADEVAGFLRRKLPLAADAVRWIVAIGFAALALPLALGLFRLVRALGRALALAALPPVPEGEVDFAQAPRRAFVVALQLGLMVLIVLPCSALLQPFVPGVRGVLPLLLLLGVAGFAFWRSATQLQGHVRAGAEALVAAVALPGASGVEQERALDQMEHLLPGLGDLAPFVFATGNPWVGRTLGEINLRAVTGATVLAIRRGEGSVLTPDGKQALQSDDILVLAGTHDAIAQARSLLAQGPAS
ncbi:MAG: cation:proton antiporter [Xanthomonadales bacterium]|nr:Glutathione-regulated potassium-efflux system protein KefB [Xanthomonadales bacterium]MCC6593815.1 cation:proton antiporter [Xanthomonadales bacterium]MCE7930625.1 potassium transporter [Xanthomonadales bacterium PRO6]